MITTVSIVVAALLSLAALAYVVWPLVTSKPAPVVVENDRLTELIGRKDAVLSAIKDLEFDYHTGKLSDEDYERLDQRLRRQAIGLIQQIEKLAPESAVMDERLEAEIARLRKTQDRVPAATAVQSPVTAAAGAAPSPRSEPAGPLKSGPRFCTTCGHPVQPSFKFCAHCGAPVQAAVPTPHA